MKKITLTKNHEMAGVIHFEGTEIEVENHVYDQIMNSMIADRKALIAEAAEKVAKADEALALALKGKKGSK
jgi:hypothetical protein